MDIIAGADRDFPDLRIERRRAGGGGGGVERQPGFDRAQTFAAHVLELAVPDRLVEQVALAVEPLAQLGPDQKPQPVDAPLGLHLRRGGVGLVEPGAAGDVSAVRTRPGSLVRRDGDVQVAGDGIARLKSGCRHFDYFPFGVGRRPKRAAYPPVGRGV